MVATDKNTEYLLKNKYIMDFNRMRKNTHEELSGNCVQPFFDKLEDHLIEYIEKSTYVIGCAAWLTNKNIIEALDNTRGIKLIINKEEYLNPEMSSGKKFFYKCLRGKYNDIPDMFSVDCLCCNKKIITCDNFIKTFGKNFTPIKPANETTDNPDRCGAILSCGIVNNFSKMHHKFLIFLNDKTEPIGLWTGSYNLSKSSNFSLENALYITDKNVINEYIKEFIAIYPFSESYNWKSGLLCQEL